jgi:hypothetical protein
MTYLLHNPHLLGLAPLLAIPVLVHLLARAKPPKFLFSATALVMKVVQQTIRIKRPKDRLLLLCRTLLALMLLLIFLRPVLFLKGPLPGQDLPRHVAIVIDRSASMAWSEGGRTRFAAACDEAAKILERLSSRDRANIVWIDREPDAVFPEMGSNLDYLRDRLRDARCTNEFGHAAQAIQLALSQLKTGAGARELCIISDFQVSQWESVKLTLPEDIQVSTLWPARDAAFNGAMLSIKTDPGSPLVGENAQVVLSIGNFSDTPRNRTVIVKIDEHIVTRQVQIPAWSHGAVVLEHVFPKPGPITVDARLDEDSFGVDDWRAILVPVRQAMRVGLAGDDPRTAPVFQRALQALPWVEVKALQTPSLANVQGLDLMVLAGWQGDQPEALSALRRQGLPFIVSPAPALPFGTLARLLDMDPSKDEHFRLQSLDKAMGLTLTDPSHKAFALFRDGRFGDPSQAAFTQRLVIPNGQNQGNPLLSFTDGEPAVTAYGGASQAVLWLAPLSSEGGNWAAQAAFLPFFGELLAAIRADRHVTLPDTALPGETLAFQSSSFLDNGQLLDAADKAFPVLRVDSADEGTRFVSDPIGAPGIYRLCFKQACTSAQIVNFPETESDLRTGAPPAMAQGPAHAARSADELSAAREGAELWKHFIWAALLLIALESLLVVWLDREEQKIAQGSL